MQVGKLRDGDIGHHLLTTDGQVVRLISILGPLLLVATRTGRVYWPVHDIDRRAKESEVDAELQSQAKTSVSLNDTPKATREPKRVIRTDSEGNEKLYTSMKAAAADSGISWTSVRNLCIGAYSSMNGYRFRFDGSVG